MRSSCGVDSRLRSHHTGKKLGTNSWEGMIYIYPSDEGEQKYATAEILGLGVHSHHLFRTEKAEKDIYN